ncbi:MAG: LysM peptidoglycan-binding domain-containing protein [Clostridia bacterium]|nr:LysM peptidoglycan-binding domain-containing protein [Clostridia bacterium]
MAENTNAQNRICAQEYTVRRGDSFYLISHRLGIPLRDLLAANANINPARLMVGDVLCIPTEEANQHVPENIVVPEVAPQAAAEPLVQTPAPDLSDMDEEAVPNLDVPAMPPENDTVVDPNSTVCPTDRRMIVSEGQSLADIQLAHQLNLHSLTQANPTVDFDHLQAGQEICIQEVNTPCPLPNHYVLGTDETLESVAVKFNLPLGSFLRANPCLAPADFEAGVCIRLPE